MKILLFMSYHFSKKLTFRSSDPEVFLVKDALRICSKFTREHPCRSAISIKLPWINRENNFRGNSLYYYVNTSKNHDCKIIALLLLLLV